MPSIEEKERNTKGSWRQKGFISLTFLIVLTLTVSIVTAKADYIRKANEVYLNLRSFEEVFAAEAKVISRAKCLLLREGSLSDFQAGGIFVRTCQSVEGYDLYFENFVLSIVIRERQIIDFQMKRIGSF